MTAETLHKNFSNSPLASDGRERLERISVAQTWARLFLRESDRALRCLTHQMERAAAQTVCAIESIDPVLTIEGKKCGHGDFFQHAKTKVCVHPDCAPQHDALDGHCAEDCPRLLTKE